MRGHQGWTKNGQPQEPEPFRDATVHQTRIHVLNNEPHTSRRHQPICECGWVGEKSVTWETANFFAWAHRTTAATPRSGSTFLQRLLANA